MQINKRKRKFLKINVMKEKNSGFLCLLKVRRPYYEKSKGSAVKRKVSVLTDWKTVLLRCLHDHSNV